MASNFLQFAENSTNVYSTNEYNALNERSTGFQPNTVISSKAMNTAIKSATLVTTALMEVVSYSQGVDVGVDSQQSNVVSYIRAGLMTLVNSNIFFNVTRQENQVNGDVYTIQVGNTGNIKTINITNAAYAYEAHDVSETINGIAISEIFESNGSTVKLASNASYATTSNTATNATNTTITNATWSSTPISPSAFLSTNTTYMMVIETPTSEIINVGLVVQNPSGLSASDKVVFSGYDAGGQLLLLRMSASGLITFTVDGTAISDATYKLHYKALK